MIYTPGQRFLVRGAGDHTATLYTVVAVEAPGELAELPCSNQPWIQEERALFEELDVEWVLTLNWSEGAVPLIFTVLVCRDGTVRDLTKQRVTLTQVASATQ